MNRIELTHTDIYAFGLTRGVIMSLFRLPITDAELLTLANHEHGETKGLNGSEILQRLKADFEDARPEPTFGNRVAALYSREVAFSHLGRRIETLLYESTLGVIDERLKAFGPAFEAMRGESTPYTRLFRRSPRYVPFSCSVTPETSAGQYDWRKLYEEQKLGTEEEALRAGIAVIAERIRMAMLPKLSPENERLIQNIIDAKFSKRSKGRWYIELFMRHDTDLGMMKEMGAKEYEIQEQQRRERHRLDNRLLRKAELARIDLTWDPDLAPILGMFGEIVCRAPSYKDLKLERDRLRQENDELLRTKSPNTVPIPPADPAQNPNLHRKCSEFDLSVRSTNCLQNNGIEIIRQLYEEARTGRIKKLKNFGRKSYIEIRELLEGLGLSVNRW